MKLVRDMMITYSQLCGQCRKYAAPDKVDFTSNI